jgi:hypothetical protein
MRVRFVNHSKSWKDAVTISAFARGSALIQRQVLLVIALTSAEEERSTGLTTSHFL